MQQKYKEQTVTVEQKLGRLIEECGEVLVAAGKSVRWGLDSFNPEPGASKETNQDFLIREMQDLEDAIWELRRVLYAREDRNI